MTLTELRKNIYSVFNEVLKTGKTIGFLTLIAEVMSNLKADNKKSQFLLEQSNWLFSW